MKLLLLVVVLQLLHCVVVVGAKTQGQGLKEWGPCHVPVAPCMNCLAWAAAAVMQVQGSGQVQLLLLLAAGADVVLEVKAESGGVGPLRKDIKGLQSWCQCKALLW
jgi:hypothetical protein